MTVACGAYSSVADSARLGDGVVIGDHCTIGPGVVIGDRTVVRNYVELRAGTVVGSDCRVDSYVCSSGNNTIGNRVTLRYGVIVARGCRIDDDAYLCPRVMTNAVDANREAIGGAHVGAGSFIGTHAVLNAGITIAPGTTVGACAFVVRSIAEPGVYVGVPARRLP